ncbi:hypothetical protein DMB90_10910 [Raoultella planticola]|uniref:Uncharacterized protein n=1 Tax=Raoultella planticola TaxID=575 RepID=A0A5P6A9R5_RAOPL|nr:hypothetical protein DMB90_10910 [Raoultella planticola]
MCASSRAHERNRPVMVECRLTILMILKIFIASSREGDAIFGSVSRRFKVTYNAFLICNPKLAA